MFYPHAGNFSSRRTLTVQIRTAAAALLLLFAAGLLFPRTPAAETQTVVVEGRSAAQDQGRALDEAKNDAFREAVNQAAGVLVTADTITKNYRLVADRVFSKSRGYIKSFDVLEQGAKDGFYVVKIRAEVDLDPLTSDLEAIGLLRQVTGNQRVIVIGVEKVDNESRESSLVQQPFEEALLAKGFDVVNLDQMEALKARNAALSFEDTRQAVQFAQQHNAELLISYQALSNFQGETDYQGVHLVEYKADLTVKLIKVDTGRVRQSISESARKNDAARDSAANAALQLAGLKAASKVVDGVVAALAREFQGEGADLELIVTNIDFKSCTSLKQTLSGLRGVISVGTPHFANNTATFRLKATMQGQQFAELLLATDGLQNLEITAVEQSRVSAAWPK